MMHFISLLVGLQMSVPYHVDIHNVHAPHMHHLTFSNIDWHKPLRPL